MLNRFKNNYKLKLLKNIYNILFDFYKLSDFEQCCYLIQLKNNIKELEK